ncbi:MAG: RNA polymerase, sigma-24 subunit, ECF subfamily [Parcubacteria group bacterium GW2011_GWA2_47_26]|nr:MAG: RNA polymerase, sigma-24 subunit, ECF subfamily [Parcubacteria group bacterium GW2011_GWA2_47_26]
MPNIHDQQLVARVSQFSDQEAFVALHGQYFAKIREFLMFRVSQKEDAEDIANQVFLKAWEYLTNASAKRIRNFRAFLYRVARNEVADFYRAQGRTPVIVALDDFEDGFEVADTREDALTQQLVVQDVDHLIACVQKLPEPYREVIALRFFEELEIREVAEIIGKTIGNTRVLIHRGVKTLQKMLH